MEGGEGSLAAAQREIARLEREVSRLRSSTTADLTATAALLSTPVAHGDLLTMIVETAAHVMRARGGSLLLLDEEGDELVFEVAVGSEKEELSGMRLDLGEGIAGLVAVSGQPMAISEAQEDSRVASDIARRIGYQPNDLLCVPLVYDDRVIGVLELVDKEDGSSFTGADIESLALFASLAGVAIRQSRVYHTLAGDLEADEPYRRAMDLADLVRQIGDQSADASQTCHDILRSFLEYVRSQTRTVEGRDAG